MMPTDVDRPGDRDGWLRRIARHSDLGHAARDSAFLRQVRWLMAAPGTSPANAAGPSVPSRANLISLYQFLDNDNLSVCPLREIRARTVRQALPDNADVLIAHEVTLLDYSRHNRKRDRRPIGDSDGWGYE